MEYLFIEIPNFMRRREAHFVDDEDFRAFQTELAANPERWPVIPGCAPLRKARWGDERRGKGKRGGCRVIHMQVPEAGWIFLIHVYGKDEQDDLPARDRRVLRGLARELRDEALRRGDDTR